MQADFQQVQTYYDAMLEAQITRSQSHFDVSKIRYDAHEKAMNDYTNTTFKAAQTASLSYLDAAIKEQVDNAAAAKNIYKREWDYYEGLIATATISNAVSVYNTALTHKNTVNVKSEIAVAELANKAVRVATDLVTAAKYKLAENVAWVVYYVTTIATEVKYLASYIQTETTFYTAKKDADEAFDVAVIPAWLCYAMDLRAWEASFIAAVAHCADPNFVAANWFNNSPSAVAGDFTFVTLRTTGDNGNSGFFDPQPEQTWGEAFWQAPSGIFWGICGALKEVATVVADTGRGTVYIGMDRMGFEDWDRDHFKPWSNSGAALMRGPGVYGGISPEEYRGKVIENLATFGAAYQVDSVFDYWNGDISKSDMINQMGTVGFFQVAPIVVTRFGARPAPVTEQPFVPPSPASSSGIRAYANGVIDVFTPAAPGATTTAYAGASFPRYMIHSQYAVPAYAATAGTSQLAMHIEPPVLSPTSFMRTLPSGNGILGFFEKGGFIEFSIKATDSGYHGRTLFNEMYSHLGSGNQIKGIRGNWIGLESDNFVQYLKLRSTGLSPEEAAYGTWTGLMAREHGFYRIRIVKEDLGGHHVVVEFY